MRPIPKGEYGYIRSSRMRTGAACAILLSLVLFLFFFGLVITGSNRNLFSILAALFCLPAGVFCVRLIMLAKARPCSAAAHEAIEAHRAGLFVMYDLLMTSQSYNYAYPSVCVGAGQVLCFTEDREMDEGAAAKHIRLQLALSKYHDIEIRIVKDLTAYLMLLDEAEALRAAAGEDLYAAERAWQAGTTQTIPGVLRSISL